MDGEDLRIGVGVEFGRRRPRRTYEDAVLAILTHTYYKSTTLLVASRCPRSCDGRL